MNVGFKLISKHSDGILSLDEAKDHLRIPREDDSQDSEVMALIEAAIQVAEDMTERIISLTTYDFKIRAEEMTFSLPYDQFVSVSEVKLFDQEGNETDGISFLEVDDFTVPATLTIKKLPELSSHLIIRATFGYDPVLIPKSLVQGIKMTLYHFYDNRSEVEVGRTANLVPQGAKMMFHMNRYQRF
jgi:uncharacterized phiE125 gp8 family phage protein